MDDDSRELEPDISDHPFQSGTWPAPVSMSVSTAGRVATAGRSTPTSAERNPPPYGRLWTGQRWVGPPWELPAG